MARLYANENLPEPTVQELKRLGHDVVTMRDSGHAGRAVADSDVLHFATTDNRIVVTLNRRHFISVTQLEELPARMDRLESQIVHLRTEMQDEFSAVREEIRTGGEEIRGEMGELATRREMREEFAAARQEIRTGDVETRRYMRMLFEEYIDRMKTIDEGTDGRT